jgi:hypothetical protein
VTALGLQLLLIALTALALWLAFGDDDDDLPG